MYDREALAKSLRLHLDGRVFILGYETVVLSDWRPTSKGI